MPRELVQAGFAVNGNGLVKEILSYQYYSAI